MEIQTNYLAKFEKSEKKKINSERAEILCQILDEINKERPCKYKDKKGKIKTLGIMKPAGLSVYLSHLKKPSDLYFILSQGRDYRSRNGSFNKYLFGSIKVKI